MSWIAIKITLKKIWSFIKNYWHFPVVLVAIFITFLVTRKSSERFSEILKMATNNHKKELDIIRDRIIDEFDGDPESLAKEMSRKFGATYVPRN